MVQREILGAARDCFSRGYLSRHARRTGERGTARSLLVTYQEHKAQIQESFEVFKGAGRDQRFRILMNPGS